MWVQLAMAALSAMSQGDTSAAGGQSFGQAHLNTSGWAVGDSDATGGGTSSVVSTLAAIPWWGYAGFTLAALYVIKKA